MSTVASNQPAAGAHIRAKTTQTFRFQVPKQTMEFEPGHLDADRTDDVGTPLLLRPIMWMLGGSDTASERRQQQEEGHDTLVESARSTGSPRIAEIDEDGDSNDENINTKGNASPPRFDDINRGNTDDDKYPSPPPGVVRASDGDFCDDLSSSEEDDTSPTLDSGGVPSTVAQMAELALSESSSSTDNNKAAAAGRSLKRSNRFQHPCDRLGKSSRTMSWSDERGNDLATYHYVSFFFSFSTILYKCYYVIRGVSVVSARRKDPWIGSISGWNIMVGLAVLPPVHVALLEVWRENAPDGHLLLTPSCSLDVFWIKKPRVKVRVRKAASVTFTSSFY